MWLNTNEGLASGQQTRDSTLLTNIRKNQSHAGKPTKNGPG